MLMLMLVLPRSYLLLFLPQCTIVSTLAAAFSFFVPFDSRPESLASFFLFQYRWERFSVWLMD
jgi:hypothetical protein